MTRTVKKDIGRLSARMAVGKETRSAIIGRICNGCWHELNVIACRANFSSSGGTQFMGTDSPVRHIRFVIRDKLGDI